MRVSSNADTAVASHWRGHSLNVLLIWLALALAPIVAIVVSLAVGRYAVSLEHVAGILLSPLTGADKTWTDTDATVVLIVRLPRALLSAVCGAGLAVAGAALQGLFRNPLVAPQILGVSSGAGFGGALSLLFGLSGLWLIGASFAGAWVALLAVLLLARVEGRTSLLMLVLAGLVVGALFSALTSICVFLADPEQRLPGIVFWLLGSFATADGQRLLLATGAISIGAIVIVMLAWRIDVLSLGDEDARALGQPVDAIRWAVLAAVSLIVAGQVAVSGIIGWVGLVIPHMMRGIVGPDHRRLIPASILAGAAYLTLADTLARSVSNAEIPLGILTALVGAPVFAILLRRMRAKGGGDE
ncbi:Molybdate import system permease protein MolB [Hyphomicrobiales bacterium]|nr:Molybdate import system permease protein MolB [Hyphomicrobiales bacterium]CAH1666644.1 Molybdate import system permease protein MolB [Hyphomicrobiales bacterium]